MSSPFYIVTLPVLPFCMGYLEETCWTWFDILIYASTTQKNICSFELSLFSYFLALVYQLIVRSNCAFVLSMPIILVVCQAILIRNDQEKQTPVPRPSLGLGQSSCIPQIKCLTSFCSVLPSSITPFMSRISQELHHLLRILDAVILLAIITHFLVPCCCNRNADK